MTCDVLDGNCLSFDSDVRVTVLQDPLQDVVSVSLSPVAEASTPFWLHPSSIANCVYLVDPCPDDGADKAPGTFRSAAARARASAASAGLSLSFLPHAANVGAAVKKARRITGKYCMSTQVFGAGLLEKVTDLAEEMTKAGEVSRRECAGTPGLVAGFCTFVCWSSPQVQWQHAGCGGTVKRQLYLTLPNACCLCFSLFSWCHSDSNHVLFFESVSNVILLTS